MQKYRVIVAVNLSIEAPDAVEARRLAFKASSHNMDDEEKSSILADSVGEAEIIDQRILACIEVNR